MYFPISQFQTQHPVYLKNQLFYSCSCEFQIVFKCLKSYDCYERKIINFRPSSIIFSFVSCSLCIAILSLRFGELRSLFVSIVSMKNQWFAKVKINVTSNVFYFYPDFYLVEREGSWRDIFSSEKSNSRFYQAIISIFEQFTINFFQTLVQEEKLPCFERLIDEIALPHDFLDSDSPNMKKSMIIIRAQ